MVTNLARNKQKRTFWQTNLELRQAFRWKPQVLAFGGNLDAVTNNMGKSWGTTRLFKTQNFSANEDLVKITTTHNSQLREIMFLSVASFLQGVMVLPMNVAICLKLFLRRQTPQNGRHETRGRSRREDKTVPSYAYCIRLYISTCVCQVSETWPCTCINQLNLVHRELRGRSCVLIWSTASARLWMP